MVVQLVRLGIIVYELSVRLGGIMQVIYISPLALLRIIHDTRGWELTAVEDEFGNNVELKQLLECLAAEGREKEPPQPSREACERSVGGYEDGNGGRACSCTVAIR